MKFLAIILCFYVNFLAVIPTVRVVKMTMELKCHDACCGKAKVGIPNGCQKEKCLMNLNFNTAPFLVFESDYNFQEAFLDSLEKESTVYNNILIPNFRVVIWQPPEFIG
ncbi:hypothetical protein [Flavobacterium wongokense]|uniref:hypothetical protein n=1 Tax=Flavobacterium wongokense TaxID=2910674 RepID=UPI001F1B3819|nr:hypothetical protein [Flavobacterium sp. WG47]MCF6132851.1 hypothetical protein [Flavobacterium sp. WG47]